MQDLINRHSEVRLVLRGIEKQHCENFFERFKTVKKVHFQQGLNFKDPSFAKQGNPNWKKKDKEQYESESKMRQIIGKARATRLEGSFGNVGNEKNHYLLNKIKARNEHTEVVWIFFGVLTANASIIAQKRFQTHQSNNQSKPPPQLPLKPKSKIRLVA